MIAAFAPATVSNVAAGFDVLGFALDEPGDVVAADLRDEPGVAILDITGDGGRLTRDAARNTAGAAVEALLALLGTSRGIALTSHKGLPLASGVGSSGASAVAAVVAVNELLGRSGGVLRGVTRQPATIADDRLDHDARLVAQLGGHDVARFVEREAEHVEAGGHVRHGSGSKGGNHA